MSAWTPTPSRCATVATEEDARREAFVGSPTIRIDGRDLQPTDGRAALG